MIDYDAQRQRQRDKRQTFWLIIANVIAWSLLAFVWLAIKGG